MTFPWLTPSKPAAPGTDARLAAQLRELRERAALLYRLGYAADAATTRLAAAVAWEHESSGGGPSADAIAKVVKDTYARRPSGQL